MTSRVMKAAKLKALKAAGKKTAKVKSKRITPKQKSARRKNIAIARTYKKKGKEERAKENIRMGFALSGAKMSMHDNAVRINNAEYDQEVFQKKHGRRSKMIQKKIDRWAEDYESSKRFYEKYKNRKTRG